MRRAYARQTTGYDFAAFGDKLRQQANVFVVDRVDFLDTEFANFLATEKISVRRVRLHVHRGGVDAALRCVNRIRMMF